MKEKFATKLGTKLGVAGLLLAGLACHAHAAPAAKISSAKMSTAKTSGKVKAAPKATQMTGTITSVRGMALTVKPVMKSNGASKTVMVPKTASVMMGGKKVALSSLKAGEKATIMMSGTKITRINVAPGRTRSKTLKATAPTRKM
jgi:hypothetical protein